MATDPEIKDKFPLPVWLKTKPTKEFEAFPSSPPGLEDSFFYIRYPKPDALLGNTKVDDVTRILTQAQPPAATNRDWSNHTKPCQEVMHGVPPINTAVNPVSSKPKPAGTDDGFKGEGAACGTSIVKVAQDMISTQRSGRGFTVAEPREDNSSSSGAPAHPRMGRRNSKSAPVSPAGSPTSRRKNATNRYFTSPFEPVPDGSGRSWLTSALLGFKKDLTTSTSTLAEEDALETRLHASTLAESVESLGPAPKPRDPPLAGTSERPSQQPSLNKPAPVFRPKPSELREMNFWSPTSM